MDNPEEGGDTENEEEQPPQTAEDGGGNRGTLILDATCCPADIHYPTDAWLLNHTRELVEKMIDVLYPASQFSEKPRTYRQKARKEYLAYIKKRSHTTRQTRKMIRGNLQYIRRDIGYIEKMAASGVSLALLGKELYRELSVIQEICRQQWDMYRRNIKRFLDFIPKTRLRLKCRCSLKF